MYLPIDLSTYISPIHLFIHSPIHLSNYPIHLPIRSSISPSIYQSLSINSSISPSIHLYSFIPPSIHLYPFIPPSICLSIHSSIALSIFTCSACSCRKRSFLLWSSVTFCSSSSFLSFSHLASSSLVVLSSSSIFFCSSSALAAFSSGLTRVYSFHHCQFLSIRYLRMFLWMTLRPTLCVCVKKEVIMRFQQN